HLVARLDARRGHRHLERARPAVRQHRVLRTDERRELLLERDRLGRIGAREDPAVEDGHHRAAVVVGDLRPRGVVRRSEDGFAAEDGQVAHVRLAYFFPAAAQSNSIFSWTKRSCCGCSPVSAYGLLKKIESGRAMPFSPRRFATSMRRTRSRTSGAARTESWQRKLIFICIGTPAKPMMSMLSQASFASPRG